MPLFVVETDNPVRHQAYAVYGLMLVNAAVYAYAVFNGIDSDLIRDFGFVPAGPSTTTVVASMFIHAGFWHLLGNVLFLWTFGDNVEDVLGPLFLLMCYLVCGIAGTHAYQIVHPGSGTRVVGASGAVSGLMGMYAVLFPKAKFRIDLIVARIKFGSARTTAVSALTLWCILEVFWAMLIEIPEAPFMGGVAFSAHVGGFATGALLGALCLWMGYDHRYDRHYRRPW